MNYQERVKNDNDVKLLFERVKHDARIARYRGYDGKYSYGISRKDGEILRFDEEVWFDNPNYIPEVGRRNAITHPSHYTYGKIECIDFILDKQLDFPLGNAVKYIVRAGHKNEEGMTAKEKAIEDLKKAIQYINFEIEHLEGLR